MSKLVVHHLELSRSFRVLWLLEELDVPYEVKHYKRNDEGIAALYKIHPLGKQACACPLYSRMNAIPLHIGCDSLFLLTRRKVSCYHGGKWRGHSRDR